MKNVQDIHAAIMAELCVGQNLIKNTLSDVYRDALLAVIKSKGRFWSWKLLLVPIDGDFVYLAYMIILGREVDRQSYLRIQAALAAGTQSRTDVIRTLMCSEERRRNERQSLAGNYLFLAVHAANRISRKVPRLAALIRGCWIIATGPQRARRSELLMQFLREELIEVNLRSIDTVEYLHNLEKRNSR